MQRICCVAAVGITGGDLHHFLQQTVIEGCIEAQLDEAAVVHDQIVFHCFVGGLGRLLTYPSQRRHLLGQLTHLMAFGHLVEDLDPLAFDWRVV